MGAGAGGHCDRRAVSRRRTESPAKVFLDFAGETYTYSQIWDLSLRRAAGLDRLGVGAGQTVVCILDNNIDAIVSWFAANFLGAVWVPVNTALKGEYLRHQIGDAAAERGAGRIGLCPAGFRHRTRTPRPQAPGGARDQCLSLPDVR